MRKINNDFSSCRDRVYFFSKLPWLTILRSLITNHLSVPGQAKQTQSENESNPSIKQSTYIIAPITRRSFQRNEFHTDYSFFFRLCSKSN